MNDLQTLIDNYLYYCKSQKRLDPKTLKAYRIDLYQFMESISVSHVSNIDVPVLETTFLPCTPNIKPKRSNESWPL